MSPIIREVTIGNCRLIQGDCLEVMPLLGKVDAVITSPPYDNLRTYDKDWRGVDTFAAIANISNILETGGVCMWNVADATVMGTETGTSFRQALHALECGLNIHDTMIYIKDNVNFPEQTRYFSGHEYMFVFSKGSPKTFNPIKDRPNKWAGTIMHGTDRQPDGSLKPISGKGKIITSHGMRFNWWRMTNNGEDIGHPAKMPYAMAHDHIVSWSNAGDLILDPFMGSGTTLIACAKLGRHGIGIEISPKYFDIACERVRKAYAQPDMFITTPEPKPIQQPLFEE